MWVGFKMHKLLTFLQQKYQCIWNTLATPVNEFVINEVAKLTRL